MKARYAVAAVVAAVASVAPVSPASAARRRPTIEFRAVLAQLAPEITTTTLVPADRVAAAVTVASCDVAGVDQLPVVPTTRWHSANPEDCVVFPDAAGGSRAPRYYLGPAADTPVADARPQFVAGQGWTVKVDFTKAGSKAWDRLAEQQFHHQVAITYEGTVVSAPTIQPSDRDFTSFGGVAVISGAFSHKEAVALAAAARLASGR